MKNSTSYHQGTTWILRKRGRCGRAGGGHGRGCLPAQHLPERQPFRVPLQFDFEFVEVYRVRKFQFTSKHVEDEDSDLKERGKTRFGQICSDRPPCRCPVASSSWNCDGEILSSSAIEVR